VTLNSNGRGVDAWDAQTGTVSAVDAIHKGGNLLVRLKRQAYETRVIVVH
jgi:hypothetical protein